MEASLRDIKLTLPELESHLPLRPAVPSRFVEPSNTPRHTPTDTRPARHGSPQAPPLPGAPHPLSPHLPQKCSLTGTRGLAHVPPPGSPAEGRAPALPLSTAILRSPWAFLTWGLTTPLPGPCPHWPRAPHGEGAFPGPPRLHTSASRHRHHHRHPERSSSVKVSGRKRKIKINRLQLCPLGR